MLGWWWLHTECGKGLVGDWRSESEPGRDPKFARHRRERVGGPGPGAGVCRGGEVREPGLWGAALL